MENTTSNNHWLSQAERFDCQAAISSVEGFFGTWKARPDSRDDKRVLVSNLRELAEWCAEEADRLERGK